VLGTAKSGLYGKISMPIPGKRSPPSEIQNTICVVDDDEAVTDSLRVLLETFGFKVQSYGSTTEFLAERHRSAGCLVIDHYMPGVSGLDIVDDLQRNGVQIPTILMLGRLDDVTRQRATSLGVRELLDKPVAAGHRIQAIQTTLAEVG
jgi:two-component system CheB/CheR fusion protein